MRLLPALFVLLAAGPALAQSNNGAIAYPAQKCARPAPLDPALLPELPAGIKSVSEITATNASVSAGAVAYYNHKMIAYNEAVRVRNAAMKIYAGCIDSYIAGAKADIARIDAAVNAAMAAASEE